MTIVPSKRLDWKSGGMLALRLAPWLIFGPITGFFTERAASAFMRGQHGRAMLLIVLNVLVVGSIPALTAAIAAWRL